MIREAIAKLADGSGISRDEALGAMRDIMAGEATPAQVAAYITALRIRGETPDVIAASAQAMREHFTPVETPDDVVVDTCGTGGDGAHTFNISTAAAFVTAGAGVHVAKHGNRSVSSKSGSADVLEALGVNIGVDAGVMGSCLRDIGIAFLFAPGLHPAMKHAIGPRKELGIRTIFNILGPLSNPAGTRHGMIGVYAEELVEVMARAASNLGAERLFVVHGSDGLDEITTTGPTTIGEVRHEKVTVSTFHPEQAGIRLAKPEDLKGGDAEHNAGLVRAILEGERGPKRDIVVLNAAAAIAAGRDLPSIADGITAAETSIDSGAAREKLERLAARTSEHAG